MIPYLYVGSDAEVAGAVLWDMELLVINMTRAGRASAG